MSIEACETKVEGSKEESTEIQEKEKVEKISTYIFFGKLLNRILQLCVFIAAVLQCVSESLDIFRGFISLLF